MEKMTPHLSFINCQRCHGLQSKSGCVLSLFMDLLLCVFLYFFLGAKSTHKDKRCTICVYIVHFMVCLQAFLCISVEALDLPNVLVGLVNG